jgi:hypothetical protein
MGGGPSEGSGRVRFWGCAEWGRKDGSVWRMGWRGFERGVGI